MVAVRLFVNVLSRASKNDRVHRTKGPKFFAIGADNKVGASGVSRNSAARKEVAMTYIPVIRQSGSYDYVSQIMFNELLSSNEVRQFYRHSEARWVTLGVDPLRGMGGAYEGPDRRA
jgi:hypothetical protein